MPFLGRLQAICKEAARKHPVEHEEGKIGKIWLDAHDSVCEGLIEGNATKQAIEKLIDLGVIEWTTNVEDVRLVLEKHRDKIVTDEDYTLEEIAQDAYDNFSPDDMNEIESAANDEWKALAIETTLIYNGIISYNNLPDEQNTATKTQTVTLPKIDTPNIWIIIDDGKTFEGTAEMYLDCFGNTGYLWSVSGIQDFFKNSSVVIIQEESLALIFKHCKKETT